MKLNDILDHLEVLAPEKLQSSWDNSGLLAGLGDDDVKKVLISLDLTAKIVDYAINLKVDLIITHHPYFMSPMKKINDPLLIKLIRNGIDIYSMHTNLDFVKGGVNTLLAERIGLNDTSFLYHLPELETYQITVFTPAEYIDKIKSSVTKSGGAIIGNYSHCFKASTVKGSFIPLQGSNPFISGGMSEIVDVNEEQLEFTVAAPYLDKVLTSMIIAHPYETPAYRVFPLKQDNPNHGLGLVGTLPEEISIKKLALIVKERLKAPFVKLWLAEMNPSAKVKTAAVCGGSGGDLIPIAAQKADIFITSDLKYHSIIASRIPLIDAGHFFTENVVLPAIASHLKPLDLDVQVYEEDLADIHGLLNV